MRCNTLKKNVLSVDGDADASVEARIRIGWNEFRQLVPLFAIAWMLKKLHSLKRFVRFVATSHNKKRKNQKGDIT